MTFKDYYKMLGLESVKATQEDIKKAYRLKAKEYHPDINNRKNDEIIKEINEAYKVLSDEVSKKKYDKLWISYVGKSKSNRYSVTKRRKNLTDELFEIFFGDIKPTLKKDKKENKISKEEITLKIDIEEAYKGAEKFLVKNGKKIDIKIPEKSKNRDIIVLKNEGKTIDDKYKIKGDLLVNLEVQNNENYEIEGINLVKYINISPIDAVLGVKKEEDIFGEKISVIIPKGTQCGKKIILKNKGFKSLTGQKGDVIIVVNIEIPKNISDEEKNLYEQLKKLQKD